MDDTKRILVLMAERGGFGSPQRSRGNCGRITHQELHGEQCLVEIVNPLDDARRNKDYRRFASMLGPGDLVFHPRFGFGAISGLTRRDPRHPIQDVVTREGVADQAQDYYDIQLKDGGALLVPVSRAENLGLRLLTNGVAAITICLHSPAQSLPEDARKRTAELWTRSHNGEPTALAAAVRDMLAQSRGRTLRESERAWLDKSCASLSTEAALVDRIPRPQAHAAIWETVNYLIQGDLT